MSIIRAVTIGGLAAVLLVGGLARAEAGVVPPARTLLLVHDAGPEPGEAEKRLIGSTRDLLGHFGDEVTVMPVQGYTPHLLSGYSAAVYLGLREGAELPESFLGDCYDLDLPLCWIGANIQQLAQRFSLGRYGFEVEPAPAEAAPTRVVYRGVAYWREERPLPRIKVTRPQVCRVVATAETGDVRYPYAVHSGRLWYFAEVPLQTGRKGGAYLVLCDQMHDVLNHQQATSRTALVCIGAVTPDTKASELAGMVRELQSEGVSFAVEVEPISVRPESGEVRKLSGERTLVSILRGAQRAGASMIASAPEAEDGQDTRENDAGQETDGETGVSTPMSADAMAEMARCGLYPVAWASERRLAPAQTAAPSAGCSTVLERRATDSEERLPPPLPFLILSDGCGKRVMPANLPGLAAGRGEVETILEAARRAAAVPDPWVTARIAPGAPGKSVNLLLSGLKSMDYGFADLRYAQNLTLGDSLRVETVDIKQLLGDLVPDTWEAVVIGPEAGARERVRAGDEARREAILVPPGAIIVSYPSEAAPKIVFSFEGDTREVTQRAVYRVAHAIVILAFFAASLLLLMYVAQSLQRRGA